MNQLENIHFCNRESFRNWLEKNYDISPGIWMIFYKKHTGAECILYSEALEEALCFGWIDSLIKKLDDDRYVRKFTPRTNTAKWSDLNKKLMATLIEKGMMTEAGLKKLDSGLKTQSYNPEKNRPAKKKERQELAVPDFILEELARNEPALTHFNNLAATYRRNYIIWITFAKREETIRSRLSEAVELLKKNQKLGLK